jgi:hypothetical protein
MKLVNTLGNLTLTKGGGKMKLYTANELMAIYEEEKKTLGCLSDQYYALKDWIELQKKAGLDSNCSVVAFRRLI